MRLLLFLTILLAATACTPALNSLPSAQVNPFDPSQPPSELTLELPEGLEVLSVDYDAELYNQSVDGSTSYEGEMGRGFIKVHAHKPKTDEQYLLIYENLGNRTKPLQIIKFVRTKVANIP